MRGSLADVVEVIDSDSDEFENRRIQLEHRFLDFAKDYDWINVADNLSSDMSLLNAQPCGRWTVLHQAARAGEPTVVKWLLHLRADTKQITSAGRSALDLAQNIEVATLLIHQIDGKLDAHGSPEVPTAVGGFLPNAEGGRIDDYYWPARYTYQQTFKFRNEVAKARYQSSLRFPLHANLQSVV